MSPGLPHHSSLSLLPCTTVAFLPPPAGGTEDGTRRGDSVGAMKDSVLCIFWLLKTHRASFAYVVYVHKCAQMNRGVFCCSPFYFLRQDLSLSLKLAVSARLARTVPDLPISACQCLSYRHAQSCVAFM